jgi:hypothetical protein
VRSAAQQFTIDEGPPHCLLAEKFGQRSACGG